MPSNPSGFSSDTLVSTCMYRVHRPVWLRKEQLPAASCVLGEGMTQKNTREQLESWNINQRQIEEKQQSVQNRWKLNTNRIIPDFFLVITSNTSQNAVRNRNTCNWQVWAGQKATVMKMSLEVLSIPFSICCAGYSESSGTWSEGIGNPLRKHTCYFHKLSIPSVNI